MPTGPTIQQGSHQNHTNDDEGAKDDDRGARVENGAANGA